MLAVFYVTTHNKSNTTSYCTWSVTYGQSSVDAVRQEGDLPSLHLEYFLFISVPLNGGVTEHVEKLAPQLQVSGGIWERLSPDLTDDLGCCWCVTEAVPRNGSNVNIYCTGEGGLSNVCTSSSATILMPVKAQVLTNLVHRIIIVKQFVKTTKKDGINEVKYFSY